jgi:hypothetical protein
LSQSTTELLGCLSAVADVEPELFRLAWFHDPPPLHPSPCEQRGGCARRPGYGHGLTRRFVVAVI